METTTKVDSLFFPINGRKVKLSPDSFQHQCPENSFKIIASSRSPSFLSLPSQKAVFDMCEFLDAIPPTYEPLFPPALSPIHAKADLDSGFDIDIAGLTPTIHKDLVELYAKEKEWLQTIKRMNVIFEPNVSYPSILESKINSKAEATQFYYLVAACAYGKLDYVKSLHIAFQSTKDPLSKMLYTATLYNQPEIAEYCIGVGAQVAIHDDYDLTKAIVTGNSYETCKVLVEHGLGLNDNIGYHGDILTCAVENDNLDWVRFCLENHANLNDNVSYKGHGILATAAASASIEICELLLIWGARVRQSSALVIASHNGNEALVKLLLKNGSDVNEMGVASIDDYPSPKNNEGTALHVIANGRKDILEILLDYGGDVYMKDPSGKTVYSSMYANGNKDLLMQLFLDPRVDVSSKDIFMGNVGQKEIMGTWDNDAISPLITFIDLA